jgi:hypothetical protein
LHYQSINHALAISNGIPVQDHLGHSVRDILGETSLSIEPTLRHVLDSCEVVSREVAGKVPGRREEVHWIANYFSGKGPGSMTKQVAVITVDITEMKKLEQFGRLANPFVELQSKHTSQTAQEVPDVIEQYFVALSGSIGAYDAPYLASRQGRRSTVSAHNRTARSARPSNAQLRIGDRKAVPTR